MLATYAWCWWNQYGDVPLPQCIERAKQVDGVITKANFWGVMKEFTDAGVPVGVERYVYPQQPVLEAQWLAEGIERGAKFIVINAEVEWESTDGSAMRALLRTLEHLTPGIEVYGCTDTRGNRLNMPYCQALGEYVTGWMPMIYPGAFQQTAMAAFKSSLDGKNFYGKPVLPAIQTYGNVGAGMVADQMTELKKRGLPGVSAYTVAHATQPEWNTYVVTAKPPVEDDEMTFMGWLHWDKYPPGNPKFRSYRTFIGTDGGLKVMDQNAEDYNETAATTGTNAPRAVPLDRLKRIPSAPGTKEPDAP